MEGAMHRSIIPAEYELPEAKELRPRRQWLTALAIVALIVTATIALLTASETASQVSVEVSK
jgi:predicted ribosomally synthesized peptide with SipW-like signal peptide